MKKNEEFVDLVIREILEITFMMELTGIGYEDLDLDREDKIIMNQFSNVNYNHNVDPKYFEKGLRVVRRIRKKVDKCLEKTL